MGTTPGSKLDELASFWDFATKTNEMVPVVPFTSVTTYDAGIYTGTLTGSSYYQRGDNRTSGGATAELEMQANIAEGRSVLQRKGYSAGIMTNTYWLAAPTGIATGGGQHGTVWSFKDDVKLNINSNVRTILNTYQSGRINNTSNTRRPFVDGAASLLVVEGDIQIPLSYVTAQNANLSVGQVNYYLYFWDTTSGKEIAIVLGLWDSRTVAVTGCTPVIRNDNFTDFASVRACTSIAPYASLNGKYATFDGTSGASWPQSVTFSTPQHYKVSISGQNLLQIIQDTGGGLSQDLRDYVLTSALFGTELVGPMSLGTSVTNFSVYLSR